MKHDKKKYRHDDHNVNENYEESTPESSFETVAPIVKEKEKDSLTKQEEALAASEFAKMYQSFKSDDDDDESDFELAISGNRYLVRYTLVDDDDDTVYTKEVTAVDEQDAEDKVIISIENEEIDIVSVEELEEIETEDDLAFLDEDDEATEWVDSVWDKYIAGAGDDEEDD